VYLHFASFRHLPAKKFLHNARFGTCARLHFAPSLHLPRRKNWHFFCGKGTRLCSSALSSAFPVACLDNQPSSSVAPCSLPLPCTSWPSDFPLFVGLRSLMGFESVSSAQSVVTSGCPLLYSIPAFEGKFSLTFSSSCVALPSSPGVSVFSSIITARFSVTDSVGKGPSAGSSTSWPTEDNCLSLDRLFRCWVSSRANSAVYSLRASSLCVYLHFASFRHLPAKKFLHNARFGTCARLHFAPSLHLPRRKNWHFFCGKGTRLCSSALSSAFPVACLDNQPSSSVAPCSLPLPCTSWPSDFPLFVGLRALMGFESVSSAQPVLTSECPLVYSIPAFEGEFSLTFSSSCVALPSLPDISAFSSIITARFSMTDSVGNGPSTGSSTSWPTEDTCLSLDVLCFFWSTDCSWPSCGPFVKLLFEISTLAWFSVSKICEFPFSLCECCSSWQVSTSSCWAELDWSFIISSEGLSPSGSLVPSCLVLGLHTTVLFSSDWSLLRVWFDNGLLGISSSHNFLFFLWRFRPLQGLPRESNTPASISSFCSAFLFSTLAFVG